MTAYSALAAWYDELTRDVPYAAFADYYERLFAERGGETKLLLDLCCGTGTLACLMAERGYEMIAADASADMLMSAREKASALSAGKMPLFINQSAQELDLYGTVDAAYSSLDSLSYVPFEDLPEVFRRLHLFVRPGGLLVSICARRSSCAAWTAASLWTRGRTSSASGAAGSRTRRSITAWTSFTAAAAPGSARRRNT